MASAATLSLLLLVLAVGEYNCDLLDDLHLRCSPRVMQNFQGYVFSNYRSNVVGVCERYEKDKSCLELLPAGDTSVEYTIAGFNYLCAASRRDVLLKAAASSCMASPQAIQRSKVQLSQYVQRCMQTRSVRLGMIRVSDIFQGYTSGASATSDLCPIIDQFNSCFTNYVGVLCGDEMAQVTFGLLDTIFQVMLSPHLTSCFDQVARVNEMHTVAKRSIDAMFGHV